MAKYIIDSDIYECSLDEACDIAQYDRGVSEFHPYRPTGNCWSYDQEKEKFVLTFAGYQD